MLLNITVYLDLLHGHLHISCKNRVRGQSTQGWVIKEVLKVVNPLRDLGVLIMYNDIVD